MLANAWNPLGRAFISSAHALRLPAASGLSPSRLIAFSFRSQPSLPQLRSLHAASQRWQSYSAAAERSEDLGTSDQDRSAVDSFQALIDQDLIYRPVVEAITKGMGHNQMTQVQTMTIGPTLEGRDVLAQARTGTGKTIAFLLPMIHNILKDDSLRQRARSGYRRGGREIDDIRGLIISPTRELAEQIGEEARKLCQGTGITVHCAVGGTGKRFAMEQMRRQGCQLLVATPGRLFDILTDPDYRVTAPKLNTLVLDEADRLLDQGFSQSILEIIDTLPDRNTTPRQTMLYSATVPQEVMGLVRQVLLPDHQFIRTVKPGEEQTHTRIPQLAVSCVGLENNMPALLELCKRELASETSKDTPFKAICFFQTTSEVELAYAVFRQLRSAATNRHPLYPAQVYEIHSKLTQGARTNASQRFRASTSGILFATDVVARGMDFPNVTHVIQIGPPQSADQYVHRLGRTGRGDKGGVGYVMIADYARRTALRNLRAMNLKPDTSLQTPGIDLTKEASLPTEVVRTLNEIKEAMKTVDFDLKSSAYRSLLSTGAVNDKQDTIDSLNCWAKFGMGLAEPPGLSRAIVQKLGYGSCSGIREASYDDFGSGARGRERDSRGFVGDRDQGRRSSSYGSDPFSRGSGERARGSYGGGSGGDRGGDRRGGGGGFGGRRQSSY